MIERTHGHAYRWLVNAAILVTAVAFGLMAYAFYVRFSQSNARFAQAQKTRDQQAQTDRKINAKTDKLTCALIRSRVESTARADVPGTPEFIAIAQLGLTEAQRVKLLEQAAILDKQYISTLPSHEPCPKIPSR